MTTVLVIFMSIQIVGMLGLIWINWKIFHITVRLLEINEEILGITNTIATTGIKMNQSITDLRIPKGYRERSPID
jgi:phage-related holin